MSQRPAYFEEDLKEEEIQPTTTTSAEPDHEQQLTIESGQVDESADERKAKRWVLIRATAAEALVTFLFVFIITATSVNMKRREIDNPTIGALVTAFSAIALIYSFADVSGAHFNPSVTWATLVTGKMSLLKAILYMAAQLGGATCSSLFILATFPDSFEDLKNVVVVKPKVYDDDYGGEISIWFSFVMEAFLTFVLVYVIFATAFDTVDSQNIEIVKQLEGQQKKVRTRNMTIYTISGASKSGFAPISIGFTLGFLSFVGSSVSGGAYNPARAFGPDLVSGTWDDQWLYWVAGFTGATLAGYIQMFFGHKNRNMIEVVRSIGKGIRDSNLPSSFLNRQQQQQPAQQPAQPAQ